MTTLFDTHSHLQDEAFTGEFADVVSRARDAGVGAIALCGYDRESNASAIALSESAAGVFPTVGYHPHEAGTVTSAMLDELASQVARDDVVAVGEIGLDSYRGHSTPEQQLPLLEAQLGLAARAGKPVCIHSRAAEDAIYEPLAAYARTSALGAQGRHPGVMHCFGGTLDQALRYVELGFLISVPCTVTYPRNEETRRIASLLPLHVLVVETDSPYLPPQSLRGRRNEPAHVKAAAEAIAWLRGIPVAEVADQTTRNACRLFGVTVPVPVGAI